MIAAHQAGIPVFVTGGIGGVHRDGENSESPHLPFRTLKSYNYKDNVFLLTNNATN